MGSETKARWVKRGNFLLQRKTDRVTWVVYKRSEYWVAHTAASLLRYGRFATKREAKLWVQREERA